MNVIPECKNCGTNKYVVYIERDNMWFCGNCNEEVEDDD